MTQEPLGQRRRETRSRSSLPWAYRPSAGRGIIPGYTVDGAGEAFNTVFFFKDIPEGKRSSPASGCRAQEESSGR